MKNNDASAKDRMLNKDNSLNYDKFSEYYEASTKTFAPGYYSEYPKDMALIEKMIKQFLPRSFNKNSYWIFEMGCGTGRLTIPFLKHGYKTIGMDFSSGMLSRLQEKVKTLDKKMKLRSFIINGDVRKLDLHAFADKKIAVIIAPWSFLHSFSSSDQKDILCNLNRLLVSGGLLIDIDAFQIFWSRSKINKILLTPTDDNRIAERIITSRKAVLRKGKQIFVVSDKFFLKRESLPSIIQERQILKNNQTICCERYLVQTPYDFVQNLQCAGFKKIKVLDAQAEPYLFCNNLCKDADRIVYVACKD